MAEAGAQTRPAGARRSAGRARGATGCAGCARAGRSPEPSAKVKRAAVERELGCAGDCSACCRSCSSSAAYWYVTGGQIMSTDDAYVNAEKVGISTDVAGIVKEVDVTDNQHVAAGQILYRLDPRQFQIALDNAKANLAQTALTIESMKQDYKRMLSDVAAQQAQVDLDQTNYDRAAMLLRSNTVPQAELRSGQSHARRRQEQARIAAPAGRRCNWRSSAAIRTFRPTQHPQYLQARRRSTRRSASSITPSSRRRLAAS